MGWSDVALCLSGPVVQDLRTHFAQRWNFIYDEKYSKKATRYSRIPDTSSGAQVGGIYPPPPGQQRGFEGDEAGERGFDGEGDRGIFGHGGLRQKLQSRLDEYGREHQPGETGGYQQSHAEHSSQQGGVNCQITRSSSKWSHNISTEVSLAQISYTVPLLTLHNSIRSRTHTVRLSETASTSSTSRINSSSQLLETNKNLSRTRLAPPWLSASFVQLVMVRSTR